MMDSTPPNNPHNSGNAKQAPYDGRPRRSQRARQPEQTVDVVGNAEDAPIVVAMFLVGLAGWFLRERCVPQIFPSLQF